MEKHPCRKAIEAMHEEDSRVGQEVKQNGRRLRSLTDFEVIRLA